MGKTWRLPFPASTVSYFNDSLICHPDLYVAFCSFVRSWGPAGGHRKDCQYRVDLGERQLHNLLDWHPAKEAITMLSKVLVMVSDGRH